MNSSDKPCEYPEEEALHDFQTSSAPDLKYSVSQITTRRTSFEEDVVAFVENGIPAMGLWRPKLDDYGVDRGIERLFAAELPVSSLSFVGDFTGSNAAGFREAYDDAFETLFTAKAVRAESVIVAPGARGRYTERHERRLICDVIRELGVAAEEFGLRLAVLPMRQELSRRWTILNSLQEAIDLVEEVDHPSVKAVFDTFQDGRDEQVLERLPELVSRIGVVQVSDSLLRSAPTSAYDRLLPGRGTLPLAPIVATLLEQGFDGCFDIQVWSRALWSQPVGHILHSCRQSLAALRTTVASTAAESFVV